MASFVWKWSISLKCRLLNFFWWTRTRRSRVRVNKKKRFNNWIKAWLPIWMKIFFFWNTRTIFFSQKNIWHNPLLRYIKVYFICLNIEIIIWDYRAKKLNIRFIVLFYKRWWGIIPLIGQLVSIPLPFLTSAFPFSPHPTTENTWM